MLDVKLKLSRRFVQDISSLVNEGVSFTYQVLPDGTIKLYLSPGISLDNVQYTIAFNDASGISTLSGGSLQNLESSIFVENAEIYPEGSGEDSELVVAGQVLSIIMLILTFFMLIVGLTPVYLLIESIQFMSLFAYTFKLPPNLFYFLKEMRITRFMFMPNIFTALYEEPDTFVEEIPQKVLDTE